MSGLWNSSILVLLAPFGRQPDPRPSLLLMKQGFRRVDVIPLKFSTECEHEYKDSEKQTSLQVRTPEPESPTRPSVSPFHHMM